jgi:hypothetical protein
VYVLACSRCAAAHVSRRREEPSDLFSRRWENVDILALSCALHRVYHEVFTNGRSIVRLATDVPLVHGQVIATAAEHAARVTIRAGISVKARKRVGAARC